MEETKLYFLYTTKKQLLDIGVSEEDIFEETDPKMPISANLTNEQCLKLIPEGEYCYSRNEEGKSVPCPFWDLMPNLPKQSNGFCHYIQEGDFTKGGTFLLFDQCKECGENNVDEEWRKQIQLD